MSTFVAPEPVLSPKPATTVRHRLYRMIWRWHFYSGLIVAPVLFVTALTGAAYVFKDEIETALYAEALLVTPDETRIGPDKVLAAVRQHKPDMIPTRMTLRADPTRAVVVRVEPKKAKGMHDDSAEGNTQSAAVAANAVAVNPYTGTVTGELPDRSPFFTVLLDVHRRLFAGTFGRIVVELSASWALVSILTGLYLWWPKRGRPAVGVWYPRLSLRDLHVVPGFYLSVFAGLIVFTGLFFTLGWGSGFKWVQDLSGASTKDFFAAPPAKETLPSSRKPIALETAVSLAHDKWPESDLIVTLPRKPTDPIAITARNRTGPVVAGTLAVDRATGEVIKQSDYDDLPLLAKMRMWVLPVHMGSVFGASTKVVALLVCLLLMVLAVTGVWMWLKRRMTGRTMAGHADATAPGWLIGIIVVLGIFLPAVGGSLILILLGDWVWGRTNRLFMVLERKKP